MFFKTLIPYYALFTNLIVSVLFITKLLNDPELLQIMIAWQYQTNMLTLFYTYFSITTTEEKLDYV